MLLLNCEKLFSISFVVFSEILWSTSCDSPHLHNVLLLSPVLFRWKAVITKTNVFFKFFRFWFGDGHKSKNALKKLLHYWRFLLGGLKCCLHSFAWCFIVLRKSYLEPFSYFLKYRYLGFFFFWLYFSALTQNFQNKSNSLHIQMARSLWFLKWLLFTSLQMKQCHSPLRSLLDFWWSSFHIKSFKLLLNQQSSQPYTVSAMLLGECVWCL